jgi:hypothetical protein
MKPENRLKDIQIALKLADWFSTDEHVDYNADLSLGHLFPDGRGSGHAKVLIFNNKHCIFKRFSAPGEIRPS